MLEKIRTYFATKMAPLAAPDAALLALFGGGAPTAAGESIGPESAMRIPAFLAGMRAIAESMASVPLSLYRRGQSGARERDRDHHAAKVLLRPAPWTSSYEFRLGLVIDAILHGESFAVAARVAGKARELHRVANSRIRVDREPWGEPVYRVTTADGSKRAYGWRDVVHLAPIPNTNGGSPLSLVAAGREALGLAATLEKHAGRLFANGGRPGGVLRFPGKLSKQAAERIREAWNAANAGERAGGTAVLEEGANFESSAMKSVDAQFAEMRRFQILEIARLLRVPPHFLAEMERATHANSEELGLQFVAYCLRPWADLIEPAFARVLLTDEEQETYFIEHNFDDLAKADLSKRADALQKLIASRLLNPNEARALENRPPYAGGEAFINPNISAGATPAKEPA